MKGVQIVFYCFMLWWVMTLILSIIYHHFSDTHISTMHSPSMYSNNYTRPVIIPHSVRVREFTHYWQWVKVGVFENMGGGGGVVLAGAPSLSRVRARAPASLIYVLERFREKSLISFDNEICTWTTKHSNNASTEEQNDNLPKI